MLKKEDTLRLKFLGSMVGTGVGDAIGAGFEGHAMVDEKEVLITAEKRHALTYTDDTHMMIGIAESLIARGHFDGEDMARQLIENYHREPWRGYGPGPPRVFQMIIGGERWDRASRRLYGGGSLGNGAAMRIAPVGVFYYDNPSQLREVALQSSLITHAHELGREGACLQAHAVALATATDPAKHFDAATYLSTLSGLVQHDVFRKKLQVLGRLLGQPEDRTGVIRELGHGVEAHQSVPTAIFAFLSHPHSFEKAVLYAVSLGGDTDTIAAMTGAIAGAFLGIQAIPKNWRSKLENVPYIEKLAEELYRTKTGAT